MKYSLYDLLVILVFLWKCAASGRRRLESAAGEDRRRESGRHMHSYLMRHAKQAFQQWRTDYENRKTPEQIAVYQKQMREQVMAAIGGLPDRTAMEPQVVATVSRPGYRVEKIIFQSQPKHYVSALLFLPAAERFKPRYPGVIVPCGHAKPAKGHPEYQSMGAIGAKRHGGACNRPDRSG